MLGLDASAWLDAQPLHYRAKQQQKRRRQQLRAEADARRRETPEAIVALALERAGARERMGARCGEPLRTPLAPGQWWFVRSEAQAGDPDARTLLRAECEPLWRKTRRERHAMLQELVQHRLHEGVHVAAGCVGGNPAYRIGAFTHRGLVSDTHPILQAFVTKLRRAPHLQSGRHKGEAIHAARKILACDDPYIVANEEMRGVLRVELDTDFSSWVELEHAIIRCGVPLPNIAVGYVDGAGCVLHPHLIWVLENSVCATGNARAAPRRLYELVLAGLTAALLPIGADPGGRSNAMRMKNPLSPVWSRCIMAELPYTLAPDPRPAAWGFAALAPRLDLTTCHARLRAAAGQRKGKPIIPDHSDPEIAGRSNSLWRHLCDHARERVGFYRNQGDSLEEFTVELALVALSHAPRGRPGDERAAGSVKEGAARRLAERIAHETWNYRPRRHPRAATPEARRERQVEAQARGAATRSDATLAAIVEAIRRLSAGSGRVTQGAVAEATGRGERTIRRHWQAALAAAAEPAIHVALDKKGRSSPPLPRLPAVPEVHGQRPAARPYEAGKRPLPVGSRGRCDRPALRVPAARDTGPACVTRLGLPFPHCGAAEGSARGDLGGAGSPPVFFAPPRGSGPRREPWPRGAEESRSGTVAEILRRPRPPPDG